MADRVTFRLCDACASRQGDRTDIERVESRDCFICGGLTSKFPKVERSVIRRAESYQFKTFSIGVIVPRGIQEREDQLRSDLKVRGMESIKSQLSRNVSQAIGKEMKRKVDHRHPDVTILVDLERGVIDVASRSIFVYGRYTKPSGVSQRRELCESCGGKGCGECDSGYRRVVSVEGILEKRLGRVLHSNRAKFTWLGSEDPSSRVFPPGRPFIAEVKGSRRREVPTRISARTGKGMMNVVGLRVLRGRPASIPGFTFKTRAYILPGGRVERIPRGLSKALTTSPIQFRNSKGKTVNKRVYRVSVKKRGALLVAEVKLDGGLPVKRLVSGGAVSISLAELLKMPLDCQRFDILRVWESGSFKFGTI